MEASFYLLTEAWRAYALLGMCGMCNVHATCSMEAVRLQCVQQMQHMLKQQDASTRWCFTLVSPLSLQAS